MGRLNRLIHIRVDHDFLTEMFTKGWKTPPLVECTEGLPEGARLVRTFDDLLSGYVTFVYEHESFAEVEQGALPPVLNVVHSIKASE